MSFQETFEQKLIASIHHFCSGQTSKIYFSALQATMVWE